MLMLQLCLNFLLVLHQTLPSLEIMLLQKRQKHWKPEMAETGKKYVGRLLNNHQPTQLSLYIHTILSSNVQGFVNSRKCGRSSILYPPGILDAQDYQMHGSPERGHSVNSK